MMTLDIYGVQTLETEPFVATATLRTRDGRELTLDRDMTGYSLYEEGKLFGVGMTWRGLYLWDGERADYNVTPELFYGAAISLVVEDDAPEGYSLKLYGAETGDGIPLRVEVA